MDVRLTVLGSGTSVGVPTIGCSCDVCTSPDPRDKRLRPSVVLRYNGRTVLIDTTPDFRYQMIRAQVGRLDAILYTHAHADHILGLDDVRPFNFHQQGNIPIYADAPTLAVIRRMFSYIFESRPSESSRPRLDVHEMDGAPFDLFGLTITPIPIRHGSAQTWGFRFGNGAYLTDHSEIPETSMDLLHGLDVLFLDALRYKPHPTHSTIEKSLQHVHRLSPRRTYFTHASHDLSHVQVESTLPPHVHMAYDGLDLIIPAGRKFSVWRKPDHLPDGDHPRAVTIGNFDGTHLGHRALFRRVVELAREAALIPAVLTFDPHPTRVLKPERAPRLLTTPERRWATMEGSGIEQVLVLPFDKEVAALAPDDFVRRILLDDLQTRRLVVGENFRYGAQGAGNIATLREAGQRYGFAVEVVGGVHDRGQLVSSTRVRNLVATGEVAKAARLLGAFYGLDGHVVRGHGVGRTQTVPTLNLDTRGEILPADGVYVTRTFDLDTERRWRSITNVGVRPTFQGEARTIETFLLDALTEPTPHRIRVEFLHRVREERRFPDPAALKAQILKDVGRAQAWFRHAEFFEGRVSHIQLH